MLRKYRFIVPLLCLGLLVGCSKNNPVAPNIQPEQGKLMFALDAADNIASGTVTITKGTITHVLPITITNHTGSVAFEGIQVGTWSITVQLFDAEGLEIYSGSGEAVVIKNQITTVTIQVEHNTGKLVIIVDLPNGGGTCEFIAKWGSEGDGDGQFVNPVGIAVDQLGNVYTLDVYHDRVQKFDDSGNYITQWGSEGDGDGQFVNSTGIAADNMGNIYVIDQYHDRVQKFDANGVYITQWGSEGHGDGQFYVPAGIATDNTGHVYVLDSGRVQKFDSNGTYITKWIAYGTGIAADSSGYVYILDRPQDKVRKYNADGLFITEWGSTGDGPGQLENSVGIATDNAGHVYTLDVYHDRVQKFQDDGMYIALCGSEGDGDGQFVNPSGIAADHLGHVYVIDKYKDNVQKIKIRN